MVHGLPAVGLAGVVGHTLHCTGAVVTDIQGTSGGAGDLIAHGQAVGLACHQGCGLVDRQTLGFGGAVGGDGQTILTNAGRTFLDGAEPVGPAVSLAVAVGIGKGAVDDQLGGIC